MPNPRAATEGATEARYERIAKEFHQAYEELAPIFGYRTREESAKPWKDVPRQNQLLMIATVKALIEEDVIRFNGPTPPADTQHPDPEQWEGEDNPRCGCGHRLNVHGSYSSGYGCKKCDCPKTRHHVRVEQVGGDEREKAKRLRKALCLLAIVREAHILNDAEEYETYDFFGEGLLCTVPVPGADEAEAELTKAGVEFIADALHDRPAKPSLEGGER